MEKNIILLQIKLLSLTLLSVFVLVLHCGCSVSKSEIEHNRASASVNSGTLKTYRRESPYAQKPTSPPDTTSFDAAPRNSISINTLKTAEHERAKKIAVEVVKVTGIFRASVVITDRTALIGLEIDGGISESELNSLRRDVEKTVKELDSSIEYVAVTASPELVKRITGMADSVIVDDDMLHHSGEMTGAQQKRQFTNGSKG